MFNVTNVSAQHDLSLVSSVDKDSVGIGDTVTFQLILINDGGTTISNIQIENKIPAGLSYISHQPSSANFADGTGIWQVANMSSTQDSLVLDLMFEVIGMGLQFNIAEILSHDGDDSDSAPNNQIITEDDYTNTCISVPILVGCRDVIDVLASAPTGYAGYQWYKDGVAIAGATNDSLVITEQGRYTFSTNGEVCEGDLCCPIIVQQTACLGDLVWEDSNNDGIFNNGETGIDGIEVILYSLGADNTKGTSDDIGLDTLTTAGGGLFLFDHLFSGDYYLKLNSGIPTGMISSTASFNDTFNTEPALDPDNDVNNDDNGTQMGTMVMSEVVSIAVGGEPTDDGDTNNNSNLTVDFGLFTPLSLGNLVWEDLDNDGQAEIGEPGIENIELILYAVGPNGIKDGGTGDDIEIARDVTDAMGTYLFDTLGTGTYFVKINSGIPTDMYSATGTGEDGTGTSTYEPFTGTDNNINNDDDGTQMGTMIMSDTVLLVKNTEPTNDDDADNNTNFSVDFGLIRYLSIGNLVWTDSNNDGLFNNGETGLDGINTLLYKDGGDGTKGSADDVLLDSMLTTGGGLYEFDSLAPGQYFVKLKDLTPGLISSTGEGTTTISGTGTYEPATDPDATDTDSDDSGIQMGYGDTAMVMSDLVSLTLSDEPINDGDVDSTSNLAVDFGLIQTLQIGNLVWEDLDNDGMAEIGESGIEDVEMILYTVGPDGEKEGGDDIEIKRDTTDANGNYLFDFLAAGTYYVKINSGTPTDMVSSTGTGADGTSASTSEPSTSTINDTNNDDDGTQMITATGLMVMSDTINLTANAEPTNDEDTDNNTNLSIDFGLIRLLSVGDLVWEDTNNDGLNNNGETGIDGIEVLLAQAGADNTKGTADDIILDSMLTANGGQYLFDSLYPGDYYLKLNDGLTMGMVSSTGEGTVALTGTGSAEPAADPDATDTNNDDDGTQMGTMVMSDLVTLSLSDEPTNDGDADTTSNLAVDFGLYQTLAVGNLVWEDLDNDGQYDSGTESGVEDVELILYSLGADGEKDGGDDVEIARDTTDANGNYVFMYLAEDTYYIKINSGIPAGYISANGAGTTGTGTSTYEPFTGTDNDADNDDDGTQMGTMVMSDTFQLVKNNEPINDGDTNNNTNTSIDFGLIPSMSLGNLVWEDTNNDGQNNNGETGIDGITVYLMDAGTDGTKGNADDTILDSIVTAAGGQYLFDTLYPGDYYVKLNSGIPDNLISSTGEGDSTAVGTGTYETAPDVDDVIVDNDDNGNQMGTMIMSDLITMELYQEPVNDGDIDSTTNYGVDFGLFHTLSLGNLVWEDLNNDGNYDSGTESGLNGVKVVLYQPGADGIKGNADDVLMARDTTDANGNYLFEDLYPNNYYLVLASGIPANMVSSSGEGALVATGTGTNEPAADPDDNTDSDDDGTGMQVGNNMLIMSDIVSLGLYDEPTNDSDTDNSTNLSVDFGLYQTLTLGNLVWEDLDNDGEPDANEPKLANIELILFKDGGDGTKGSNDDIEIGKDTTDSNGNYLFDNLYPGDYFVKINDLPFGMISSTGEGINNTTGSGTYEPAPDADGNTDNLDDGTYMDGMVMSSLISLNLYDEPINDSDTDNSTNLSVDFGLFQTLVLGNLVWEDLDNDGIADTNEPGMENIEVVLFRDNNGTKGDGDDVEIARDTTGTDGAYMFVNLDAGMYYVKLNNIPLGYMSSTGEGTANITGSGAYEPAPDPDVYADNDDNGTQMNMPDGSIMVMSDLISMVLYSEQTDSVVNMDVDFGLYNTLEAGNFVWEDLNNNGLADAGEPGISNIEVIIYQTTDGVKGNGDDIEIDRDTTDAMGMYLFQSLEPGDYWVKLNSGIPNGFRSSTGEGTTTITGTGTFEPSSMVDDNIDDNDDGTGMLMADGSYMVMSDIVSLDLYDEPDSSGIANYRIDFGLFETMDLGNLVWEDLDNDGEKDSNESGFPDVEVVLYQPGADGIACTADDIEIAKDTTDANGNYLFENLNPNDYFITLNNIPDGFVSATGEGTTTADGSGTYEPAADPDGDVDNSDDGSDATLADGMSVVKSDVFSLILYDEPTNDGDVDSTTNFTVDFGLIESLALGNLVWEDANNNGIVDNSETGIENVEVILLQAGADGQIGTADDVEIAKDTTDGNGNYLFDKLYPNEYFVKLNNGIPTNFTSSTGEGATLVTGMGTHEPAADPDATDTDSDDDGTVMGAMVISDLVSLVLYDEPTNDGDTDNTTNYAVDFGLYELLSLGNLVWEDFNNDGLVDANEPGFADVEVLLFQSPNGIVGDGDDVLIAKDTTDTNGGYLFEQLTPGDYYVKLNDGIPANIVSATGEGIVVVKGTGTYEPATDPDATNTDGDDDGTQMGTMIISEMVSLALDDEPINDADTNDNTNTTVDFGLIRKLEMGGIVWNDANNNGLIDALEENSEGIEVVLYMPGPDGIAGTADDIEVDRTTIDENGEYMFDCLFPDKYFVQLVDIPAGVASSDGNGFGGYTGNGPYENNVDPNNDNDTDDNGTQATKTSVISGIVDLILYDEPIDDADNNNNTNTTIDFGLTPTNLAYIYDPCNCLGNESSQGAGDGQFSDKIVILSSIADETWSLVASAGMYAANSPAPPAAPTAISLGTIATPDGRENGFYRYVLDLKHIDGQGYGATFSNGNGALSVSNLCTYEGSCNFIVTTSPDGTPAPGVNPSKQTFVMSPTNTPKLDTLLACDKESMFVDDGLNDGLYIDTAARNNIYTICPQNAWQQLNFVFTQFGLAPGDSLSVYDGRNTSAPRIGKFGGEGVSQTGGWVATSCEPSINPSGCLTFRFETNGDNAKSNGWMGNFECSERKIELTPPNDLIATLPCEETYKVFTINPATIESNCGTVQDSQIVRIVDALGRICKDTCIAFDKSFQDTFAIGAYKVSYKLKSDTVKTAEAVLAVQGAALVCNDEVTIPLGSGCSLALLPDDLLEGPCDTITDTVYHYITLEYVDVNGKTQTITGGGKSGNYPTLTKDMIGQCGGQVKATIEKRYYEGLDLSICNNGQQSVSCETIINVVDQSAPIFQNVGAVDTFKLCTTDLSPENLGIPTPKAIDNCDSVAVSFAGINVLNQGGACDTTRANITWSASDACGNTTTINQLVVVIRPDADDVVKAQDVVLSCGEDDKSAINDFAKTGMPSIKVGKVVNGVLIPTDTIALNETDYVCGYILQKRDVEVPADCGVKVFRYWSVLDWCDTDSGIIPLDTQFIELRDTLAPTFVDVALATVTLALPHDACTTDLDKLVRPLATDNCSEPTVRLDAVFRVEDGELWPVANVGLDCDSFQVRWVAADDCHAQLVNDTLTQIVLIEDNTKPSAICTDKINLSLARDEVKLHYTDIDAGSSDACGIAKYEVSRDELNWDSTVIFTCEDAHAEVKVYLRVTDKKGNQNTCWMTVNVEDKIAPICSDLPDMTGSCDEGHGSDLAITDANEDGKMEETEWVDLTIEQAADFNTKYGNPDCSDNVTCQDLVIEQQYQYLEKACGIATIKRRYRAIDWAGEGRKSNWSEQTINIESKAGWSITLPADWKGECGDDIPNSDIFVTNGACDLIAYEVEEKVFTTTEDACLKVVRTFTIINWCIYEAGQPAVSITRDENEHGMVAYTHIITAKDYENVGKLEYIQVLKLKDDTAPIITVAEVDNCLEGPECGATKQFTITAKDCNEAATENLTYNWTLSTNDKELASGAGASFEYAVAPKVTYEVKWVVADNCGNQAKEEVSYNFWDCKKPSPYCLNGVAVELMPDAGMIQVWATDLERNSADNCTPKDKLDFRIWHANVGTEPTSKAAVLDLPKVITFDCTTLGNQTVNLYAIDEEGNWDFCVTYVNVQDNMGACDNVETPENMATVSGLIRDWKENTVEGVAVKATSDNIAAEYKTLENGHYGFELAMNEAYTIRPEKDSQPLNGVSTFDLVLIAKHILGISQFENPYQMIAADVNGSGSITAFDMVQIRQLILNINTEFVNSPSWKFVYAEHEFITANPLTETYPQVAQINDLSSDMEMDFVAIKMGDVNGNARANSLVSAESRTSVTAFEIFVEDKILKAGERYTVDFATKQLAEIQGYQFTLAYDHLKLEKLKSGVVGVDNFGLHKMDKGLITTSWNQQLTTSTEEEIALFAIEFTALHDGKLSEQLNLMGRPTAMEAYDQDGNLMEVQLTFTTPLFNDEFDLFQNTPNPYKDRTEIGFYLPDNSEVELILRDETGRVIKSYKGEYGKGYNTIPLSEDELTNGFIYYQLSSKFGTKAKKMLRLN